MVDKKPGLIRGKVGRTHDELMAELTPERRARVEARAAELQAEVEGLIAERGRCDEIQTSG